MASRPRSPANSETRVKSRAKALALSHSVHFTHCSGATVLNLSLPAAFERPFGACDAHVSTVQQPPTSAPRLQQRPVPSFRAGFSLGLSGSLVADTQHVAPSKRRRPCRNQLGRSIGLRICGHAFQKREVVVCLNST